MKKEDLKDLKDRSFIFQVERYGKSDIYDFVLSIIHPERPILDGETFEPIGEVAPAMRFFTGNHITIREQEAAQHIKFLLKALTQNSYVRDDGVYIFQVLDTEGNLLEVEVDPDSVNLFEGAY